MFIDNDPSNTADMRGSEYDDAKKKYVIELIKGLCGFSLSNSTDYFWLETKPRGYRNFKYYFIFDGKLHYTKYTPGSEAYWDGIKKHSKIPEKYEKVEIVSPPDVSAPDVSTSAIKTLSNQETQTVTFSETAFTFVKIVDDENAKSTYQVSEKFLSSDETKLKSALTIANQLFKERETKKTEAAAARKTAAMKTAQESPICQDLQTNIDSTKKAIEEIKKIKDFCYKENRDIWKVEELLEKWKKTKTPEEITEIDELIGEFTKKIDIIKGLMKGNQNLCLEYLKSQLGNDVVKEVIEVMDDYNRKKYNNSSTLFAAIVAKRIEEENDASRD